MISLDEVIERGERLAFTAPPDARSAALISFDLTPHGLVAVPRTHLNLIAGGLAVFLESAMPQGARIMTTQTLSSFSGMACSLVCWLLSGGALALHHPFDGVVLEAQVADLQCDTLIVPSAIATRLAESEPSPELRTLRHVVCLWRSPEQVASSAAWPARHIAFTDVYLFGEIGLFAVRRLDDTGLPAPIMPGPFGAPRDDPRSPVAGETLLTQAGTLALRGSMVPAAAYAAAAAEHSLREPDPPSNHVDTGYAARIDRTTGALCITAPPSGIMQIGGYRFLAEDLQTWARRLGEGAMLTALPDRLSGHRLAGRASDNARARAALADLGLNPLMVEAFRDSTLSD
jgi:hypothetical protein